MLHQGDDGRLFRIVGNGGLVPVADDDPEAVSYRRAIQEANVRVQAEATRDYEEIRRRNAIEAEKQRSSERTSRGEPPEWVRN